MPMRKGLGDDLWWMSLWLLGHALRFLHLAGSLFATTLVLYLYAGNAPRTAWAMVVGVGILVWMVMASVVSHKQLIFSWNQLLLKTEKHDAE